MRGLRSPAPTGRPLRLSGADERLPVQVMSDQTEAQWAGQVEDLALIGGWRTYRVTNSTREIVRRSGARIRVRNVNASGVGFPDLVMVHAPRHLLLFVELKRGRRKGGGTYNVTPEQNDWLDDLREVATIANATIGVYIWTPADINEVVTVLTGKVE